MNKKEVLEIRKQFKPEECAITRICGCYVTQDQEEKSKKLTTQDAFLSLPEEEEHKYFDIFKHTLSGTYGRNLLNMEFPLEQEMEGGTQEFLLRLRDSKLQDEALLNEFYDKVIKNFDYGENYYIVLIHAVYDVPGKSSDGMEMFDASDTVYEHLLCSICPVNMSKASLSYNAQTNSIEDRIRDWVVEMPMKGFLFPAFTDRNADLHGVLYYSKKPEDIAPDFIEQVLGSRMPLTAGTQKERFQSIVAETLGEECEFETIRNIHDHLTELITENKDNPEPLELAKPDVKRLLEMSGASVEQMETFDNHYEEETGPSDVLLAANIANIRKFEIETPNVSIKVAPERTDLVETRVIDGRKCLVIAVDDGVEVNGVPIRVKGDEGLEKER